MGGFLAQMAACERPDLVRSVVSISAGSAMQPEQQARLGMSPVAESTWEILMRNQPTGQLDRDLDGWLRSWRFVNGDRGV